MRFEEFDKYESLIDKENPFSNKYKYKDSVFYVEPVFHTQLMGFKMHYPERFNEIMNHIEKLVLKNKKVIFTGNFDYPQTEVSDDEFIFLEITDITNSLKIFVEDKSRGSDYGD